MLGFNENLSLVLISLVSYILLFFLTKNYKKKIFKNLLDCEFSKVQSFHKKPVLRIGGIFIFFFITISFLLFKNS